MAKRTLPGLGLTGFWPLGQDGWNDENDANLRLLSAVVQGAVLSRTTALPGSPTNGNIYIVPSGGDANKIAVRDDGAWVYLTPAAGWRVWVADDAKFAYFDGSTWEDEASGGGGGGSTTISVVDKTASHILELTDAGKYVRMNVGSANDLTVPANGDVAFPVGTVIQIRQVGAGQTTVVADTGVSINSPETLKLRKQGSSAALIKVATDEWDLTGDLEAL